jgi:uncharacterized membrane protein
LLWKQVEELRERYDGLERELRKVKREAAAPAPQPPSSVPSREPVAPPPPVPPIPPSSNRRFQCARRHGRNSLTFNTTTDSRTAAIQRADPAQPSWLVEFFTTGNVVAKVGMVIVFFGVAFLVRYAADRGLLPIEFRLIAVALGSLVLLWVGWHLRRSRPEYAMVLQGGAVGILYLTIFAAFRLYGLLPAPLTFILLLVVVAVSGVLAVVQDAMSLAVIGASGGFLAPILASTGGGSHVALFSYYAVLNLGVVGIAWFRAWRFLNWLAFVFTFGIGLVWGQQYYQPQYFATTEPFLILSRLVPRGRRAVAHRQAPELRGYIDGTLVFGAPAIAFTMQACWCGTSRLGRAYSAVVLSALYLAVDACAVAQRACAPPLAEAFLALGVVFLILAVPLAFAGHATAAAWALEGTGLVWIGVRQNRLLARLTGSALLIAAGVAFALMESVSSINTLPVLNARFLAGIANRGRERRCGPRALARAKRARRVRNADRVAPPRMGLVLVVRVDRLRS